MAAFIQKKPTTFEDVGTTCSVPNTDVAKVSYYLNCCTLACGVDVIMDDLVDYKNVHKLPQARQDCIFEIAYEQYSPEEMIGKTIFPDPDGAFTSRKRNAFLKITECTAVLAVTTSAVIGGEEKEIKTVMVFDDDWIKSNWKDPMTRNTHRIQRALAKRKGGGKSGFSGLAAAFGRALAESAAEAANMNHCDHCKGKEAKCGCTSGCDRGSGSKCYKHCEHCFGQGAKCGCTSGCVPVGNAECFAEHTAMCDRCRTPNMQGTRYKCRSCDDFDLCQSCYTESGKLKFHDTHAFTAYDRPGASGRVLAARRTAVAFTPTPKRTTAPAAQPQKSKPAAVPTPARAPAATSSSEARNGFFYKTMTVAQCKGYLREQGVGSGGASEMDELRRLVWETHCDCVSAIELKNLIADCGISDAGCNGIAARRECAKRSYEKASRPAEPIAYERVFCPGKQVSLTALNAAHMNGKTGLIVPTNPPVPGRSTVRLDDDQKEYKIKFENMTLVSDGFLD